MANFKRQKTGVDTGNIYIYWTGTVNDSTPTGIRYTGKSINVSNNG